jgi:hypothetical protein
MSTYRSESGLDESPATETLDVPPCFSRCSTLNGAPLLLYKRSALLPFEYYTPTWFFSQIRILFIALRLIRKKKGDSLGLSSTPLFQFQLINREPQRDRGVDETDTRNRAKRHGTFPQKDHPSNSRETL